MIRSLFLLLLLFNYSNSFCQAKTYNITAFGAKGDGGTLNTVFIQKAIDKAAAAGGGKVIIPAGRYVTGVIRLKNGVNLFLHKDAALLGSTNRLDYGKDEAEYLITTTNQHKVSITGYGEIDGRGREVVKDLFKLLHRGVLQDAQWKTKRPGEKNRPGMIAFTNCTNVVVKGITVKNSAGWVQDYRNCKNVVIDSVTVNSTEYWNNDGIDIIFDNVEGVKLNEVSIPVCSTLPVLIINGVPQNKTQ